MSPQRCEDGVVDPVPVELELQGGVERVIEVLAILLPKPRSRPLLAIPLVVVLLVDVPGDPRPLHKQIDALPHILNPHPQDVIDLLMIDLHPLCLADALSDEEVSRTPVRLELDTDAGVDLVADADARLLEDLSGCAVLRVLVLVPLALGEPVLLLDLDDHDLGQISVEDDGAAYRLVILQFDDEQLRVDLERSGRVILDLKQKIVPLLLPIPAGLLLEHLVHVVIEGLLKMVAEAVGIFLLLPRQVDQKPADDALIDLPLILHRPPRVILYTDMDHHTKYNLLCRSSQSSSFSRISELNLAHF